MISANVYISASLVTLCTTLAWSWLGSRRTRSQSPLPPSPKSDPFIGHMRMLMSASDIAKEYEHWAKELKSDITSFKIPGQIIIVLNSADLAEDLLSKRSSIYSDRPKGSTMAASDNLLGWKNMTAMLPYGERWRAQRRVSHELLHKRATQDLWPTIVTHSRLALQRLLDDPDRLETHFRQMAGSSIIKFVYGYEVTESNDTLFETVSGAVEGFSLAAIPGNFYVNMLPWMQHIPAWFPGAQWKRKALVWRFQTEQMLHVPYDWTTAKMASGTAPPSVLRKLLSGYVSEPSEEEKDTIRWAAATLFAAGNDTIVSSTLVLIAAMAMHPEVQAKAQAEVDSVLCGTRFPSMEDRDSMPYIEAIVKEVLRWRTVTPIGAPHACIEEDTYRGYRIPKGATVIANLWAMSNDENVYPNPERFDPSRFLDPSTPDPPAFGFGRRICPGIHFSYASLFMVASGLLAFFDILPKKDSEGRPTPLTIEMRQNLLVSQPHPFEVDIKPRSEKHERLLREWVEV